MTCAYDFRQVANHLIRRAHQRSVAIFAEEMAAFDVTPVQFAIVMTLMDKPGVDQVTLAAHVALDAATSGWLRRENDVRDRRRK